MGTALKETQWARPEPSSGALGASVRRHLPYGVHDLKGPEHQLDGWERVVGLPPMLGHGGDPALHRVVETGIGHQQVISVLDPQHLIVDQDRDGLAPEDPIYVEPEVVQANLPMLAHLARQLAEPEDPPEAARVDEASLGICRGARTSSVLPENHADFCARMRRMTRDAYLRTAAFCLRTARPT